MLSRSKKGIVVLIFVIMTLLSISIISVYAITETTKDNKSSTSENPEVSMYTNAEEFQNKLTSLSSTKVSETIVETAVKTTVKTETTTTSTTTVKSEASETTTTSTTTVKSEVLETTTESCKEIQEEIDEVRNELQEQLEIVTTSLEITITSTNTEVKIPNNETTVEIVESEVTLEEVKSKYQNTIFFDMDVTVLSGFTLEEFKILMEGITLDDENNFYTVNAEAIYNLCNEYQINEIFFCGIISAESWWGTADNCVAKNNFTGMMGASGLKYYESAYENLEATARNLHNNYLSPGGSCNNGTTISGVSICYCGPEWPSLVWERMIQIF